MAVCPRGLAVSGPSSVCNASVGVENFAEVRLGLLNERLQLRNLADLLEGKDLVPLVAIYGEPCRVVATVL